MLPILIVKNNNNNVQGESYSVGPFSFYKDPGIFSTAWDGSDNSWNDAYCFVELGIDNIRID